MGLWLGLLRSLVTYWRPGRQRSLRRLYAPFVGEGDLVFDVGAHLGDRAVAFAALGARVVAFEPQPHVARWLRLLVGRNERVTVRPEAVGARGGTGRLSISKRNPTVSTLSASWKDRVRDRNAGFRGVRWEDAVEVPIVTLDSLIETHGLPSFLKIDVEGFETEVLAGLSHTIPGLSVEFVAGDLESACACVRRIAELGAYELNVVVGERRAFLFDRWRTPAEIIDWLEDGADRTRSGDIYARLKSGALGASTGHGASAEPTS